MEKILEILRAISGFVEEYLQLFIYIALLYFSIHSSNMYDRARKKQIEALEEQNNTLRESNDFLLKNKMPEIVEQRNLSRVNALEDAAKYGDLQISELKSEIDRKNIEIEHSTKKDETNSQIIIDLKKQLDDKTKQLEKYKGKLANNAGTISIFNDLYQEISGSEIFSDYIKYVSTDVFKEKINTSHFDQFPAIKPHKFKDDTKK